MQSAKLAEIARLNVDGTNDFYFVGRGGACTSRDIGQCRALLFDCRGDHNVFEENLQACHVVVRGRIGYRLFFLSGHPERSVEIL